MAEYIDRGALIAWVEETYCKPCEKAGQDYKHARCGACQYGDMIQDIETRPAANVRPVRHGVWIKAYPDTWTEVCSICGLSILDDNSQAKYCPNCGAKMQKAQSPKEET